MTRTAVAAVAAALIGFAAPALAHASTYSNPNAIAINGAGPATPYPSTISVDGLPGPVVQARVTLAGVSHSWPADVDVLLLGPGGQRTILMSDACGTQTSPLNLVTLTFDDVAAPLAELPPGCVSGTFRPTDYAPGEQSSFPVAGPHPAALSVFAGADPNGPWHLYVRDDVGPGDAGAITGGWSLELLPEARCGGRPATVATHVGTTGDDLINGTPGPDVIVGLGGRDELNGLGGKDRICGGSSKDTLRGAGGKDRLLGQGGKDLLHGGGADDVCSGGKGRDAAAACETEKGI
jgi:hypothetical protein